MSGHAREPRTLDDTPRPFGRILRHAQRRPERRQHAGTVAVRCARGDQGAAAATRASAFSAVCRVGSNRTRCVSNGPPPAMSKPIAHGRARPRHQEVRPEVTLEVDGDVVVARSPLPALSRSAPATAGPRRRAPARGRRAPGRGSRAGSCARGSAFQLPTTRSISLAGASARTAAMASRVISRSPMRSRRSRRMRFGDARAVVAAATGHRCRTGAPVPTRRRTQRRARRRQDARGGRRSGGGGTRELTLIAYGLQPTACRPTPIGNTGSTPELTWVEAAEQRFSAV